MNMDVDAFADSAVERAANQGNALMDESYEWRGQQDLMNYDYNYGNAHLSGANSLVDMNLEDDEPMLGDIRSAEEQPLVSGDIDLNPRYKRQPQQQYNKNKKKLLPFKKAQANKANQNNMNLIIKHGSGIKDHFRAKMAQQTKGQNDINRAPEGNLTLTAWCVALFYWIPIRYLCFLGSLALFILPFLDVRFQKGISFVEWLLYWYIQLFAIVGIFIESPTWILTRKIQLGIYKWCRVLRRTWGRAAFYVSISMLTFAELQGGAWFTLSMFAGIYMCVMAVIMIMFSILAAKQYRLMYWYMATGGNIQNKELQLVGHEYNEMNDLEKLESRVVSYFNTIDADGDGKIGAGELHQFAEEALKRNLSNSERYTIQSFLDCSCNGYISRQDWTKQFVTYNQVRFL
eukprot:347228_1